jgi:hypothetical protein
MRDAELLARAGEIAADVRPRREESPADRAVGVLHGPREERSHVGQRHGRDALAGLSLATVNAHVREVGGYVLLARAPDGRILGARGHHEGHDGRSVRRQHHRQPDHLPGRKRARARLVVVVELRDHVRWIAAKEAIFARQFERRLEHAELFFDRRAPHMSTRLGLSPVRAKRRRDHPLGQPRVDVAFHGRMGNFGRMRRQKTEQMPELDSHVMLGSVASSEPLARRVVVVNDPLGARPVRGRVGRINGVSFELGRGNFRGRTIRAAGGDSPRCP